MPIYRGSAKITPIYIGGTKIGKVYKGSTLVYSAEEGFEMIGVTDQSLGMTIGLIYKNSSVGYPYFGDGLLTPGTSANLLTAINGNIGVAGSTISTSYYRDNTLNPSAYNHTYSTTRTIFGKLYYQYDYVNPSGFRGRSMIFLSPKQKVGDYIFGCVGDLNNPNADFVSKITSITPDTVTILFSGNQSSSYPLDINNSYGTNGTAIYRP